MVASGAVPERKLRLRFRGLTMVTQPKKMARTKPRLTAMDVFAGVGGLTEGLRQAGYRVLAAVEMDPLAAAAYQLNHPKVCLISADVRTVTGSSLMKQAGIARGSLDLLAACPPCQGFSALRTKNGAARVRDDRNALVLEVLRLTRAMKPKTVLVENVPRLAKAMVFRALVRGLRKEGYAVEWRILDAARYAVPQRRRRLVLIAARRGTPSFAVESSRRVTVADAIRSIRHPSKSRDPLHCYSVRMSAAVRARLRAIPKNGGGREALDSKLALACHRASDGFRDVYGRMAWNAPAPTLTGGCTNPSKGRFLHPMQNRAITLREAALLQTFPKAYKFPLEIGRGRLALMIGNALPPEMVRRQAIAIAGELASRLEEVRA